MTEAASGRTYQCKHCRDTNRRLGTMLLDPNLEEAAAVDIVRGEGRAVGADLVLGGGCAKRYAG